MTDTEILWAMGMSIIMYALGYMAGVLQIKTKYRKYINPKNQNHAERE
jgi:hypothetical protein